MPHRAWSTVPRPTPEFFPWPFMLKSFPKTVVGLFLIMGFVLNHCDVLVSTLGSKEFFFKDFIRLF